MTPVMLYLSLQFTFFCFQFVFRFLWRLCGCSISCYLCFQTGNLERGERIISQRILYKRRMWRTVACNVAISWSAFCSLILYSLTCLFTASSANEVESIETRAEHVRGVQIIKKEKGAKKKRKLFHYMKRQFRFVPESVFQVQADMFQVGHLKQDTQINKSRQGERKRRFFMRRCLNKKKYQKGKETAS